MPPLPQTRSADDVIRAQTTLRPVPHVPELLLRQADDAITLWQAMERLHGGELPPPFWAFAWAGGQALARQVFDRPDLVSGRRVLDLATGSGLVAVSAAAVGAAHVLATDIDEYAAAATRVNAAANGVVVEARCADVLDTALAELGDPQVVLAGDVFYSREMAERVLAFLRRARAGGARVLVGDPGRAYLPRARFVEVSTMEVPVQRSLEDAAVKSVTVWELP